MQHYFSCIFLPIKSWHFQSRLLYLYPIKSGIFSLCIFPCRRGHNLWCPSCLLPCFCCSCLCPSWSPMDSSPMGKSGMKHPSSCAFIHSSCSSDFALLKFRPLMLWTIQYLGWTIEAISLLFSLPFWGFCILSMLLQKILCQCSQD